MKRKLLFACLLSFFFFDLYAKASDNLKPLIENAFERNEFLIADNLKLLNPKNYIKSHFNGLDQNIYLSNIASKTFLKSIFYFPTDNNLAKANYEEMMGLSLARLKSFNQAIYHFKVAFNLSQKTENKQQTFIMAHNLSYLFLAKGDLDSTSYYNNQERIYAKDASSPQLVFNYLMLSSKIATSKNEIGKAENLVLRQALPMSGRLGKKTEFNCYLQLGKMYLKAKRTTESKWFFIQASTLASNIAYKQGEIEALLLLAKVKMSINDLDLAHQDLNKVKALVDDFPIYKADLNKEFYALFKKMGQNDKSVQSLNAYNKIKYSYLK